ncbi:MAG: hypothetical protein GYA02_09670 [Clostridiaceae bacterium]|nr:hypothetical protein [Clostridiaceae bacterium]
MNKKWKIPIIIIAIIITLGIAVKFAVDRLFSYILFSSLSTSQVNLTSLDSLVPDLNATKVLPENSEKNGNNNKDTRENPESSKNSTENIGDNIAKSSTGLNSNENSSAEGSNNNSSKTDDNTNISSVAGNKSSDKNTGNNVDSEINSSKKNTKENVEAINKNDENYDNLNSDNESEDSKDETDLDNDNNKNSHDMMIPKESAIEENKESDKGSKDYSKDYAWNDDKVNESIDNSNPADDVAIRNNTDNENAMNNSNEYSNKSDDNSGKPKEDFDTDTNMDTETDDGSTEVTPDKVKEIEKKVSSKDKLKAVNIIMSKLDSSDISTLMSIAFGGDTTEEKIYKAKQIIREKVTEEEKDILKSLFYKYEHLLYE